ncbi:sigma-70 family RNA polymerase sigma factor [bacterium]|nr:sigma-70 family RNA polymerase sigma factor [bacterium]
MAKLAEPDDDQLLAAYAGGDSQAFRVLVERWQSRILNFLYRLVGDLHLAQDLRQEVFVRVARAAPTYLAQDKFSSWIYRIALRVAQTAMRKVGRERNRVVSLDAYENPDPDLNVTPLQVESDVPGPVAALEEAELARLLREGVEQLPDAERLVLVMRHYQDLNFREISEILDVPESTLKSRFYKAMERMRRYLRRVGVSERSWSDGH